MREFLRCLRIGLRELILPPPVEDPDPQSTAEMSTIWDW